MLYVLLILFRRRISQISKGNAVVVVRILGLNFFIEKTCLRQNNKSADQNKNNTKTGYASNATGNNDLPQLPKADCGDNVSAVDVDTSVRSHLEPGEPSKL